MYIKFIFHFISQCCLEKKIGSGKISFLSFSKIDIVQDC